MKLKSFQQPPPILQVHVPTLPLSGSVMVAKLVNLPLCQLFHLCSELKSLSWQPGSMSCWMQASEYAKHHVNGPCYEDVEKLVN